jgi:hypothetical protein
VGASKEEESQTHCKIQCWIFYFMQHRWQVGVMTELAPVGYVGVSPKCLLGFNKNRGEEISLRLRTDDLRGFRKYESIKKTLLHELVFRFTLHNLCLFCLEKHSEACYQD